MAFDYDNMMHNVYGAILAIVVTVLLALQIPGVGIVSGIDNVENTIRYTIFAMHTACLAFVLLEALVFKAETPFFSQLVVATGFSATVLEGVLVGQNVAFEYVFATFFVQNLANGFMFSKIISEI